FIVAWLRRDYYHKAQRLVEQNIKFKYRNPKSQAPNLGIITLRCHLLKEEQTDCQFGIKEFAGFDSR
ncbi:MAG: hypothetical protein PVH39_05110, partial [Syntrophobacterales bacterium]